MLSCNVDGAVFIGVTLAHKNDQGEVEMDKKLSPPLTPAEQVTARKIQEKLAHLTPEERQQALEILKQIARKQALERAAGTVVFRNDPSGTSSN